MTLRFHSLILSAIVMAILSACGTTGTVPVEKPPVVVDQPPEPESDIFDLQYQMQRQPSERNLEDVIEMSRQVTGDQADVALEILRSLESIPSGELTVMIDSQIYDLGFTEWLELALQSRRVLIGQTSPSEAAQKWANDHSGHTITEAGFSELIGNYSNLFPVPAQVAVLLPADGGLSSAARAIRDGILSAYLEQPGNSVLRFYSSGISSESAIAAYL